MEIEQMTGPRLLTADELAAVIRMFRESRQWSQETLAALSGLSVRTVQRVENGEPSGIDTRRAIARAFDADDLDVFNKPYAIPTAEELRAEKERFDREHLVLDAVLVTSGREFAARFRESTGELATPAPEMSEPAARAFASMVDYLRDYRDYDPMSETEKLDLSEPVQGYIDELAAEGIVVCYAMREASIVGPTWPDKTPMPVTLIYLSAFHKDAAPERFVVSRKFSFGW
jgi:transcriptional regulator with XRE-family HTH domain